MSGWVKLHRKILESRYGKNLELRGLFDSLLLMANHKEGFTVDGTKILAGQFMTSKQSLSFEFTTSESKIRRMLKKLEIAGQIDVQSSRKNTIITIRNWHTYQGSDGQSDGQVTDERRTGDGQVTTNKNAKNNKNEENIIIKASPLSFLFNHRTDIQEWLDRGNHDTHALLLTKHSHHELADLIERAHTWAIPKNQRAENWLYTFVSNKNTHGFGANRAQVSKSRITEGNPTGNPYLNDDGSVKEQA